MAGDRELKRKRSEQDFLPKLSDKSMLDCPVCYRPLAIPVHQCENGHIICSFCLPRLRKHQCPVCNSIKPNSVRNLAIEKVLESLTDFCSHKSAGCTAGRLTYSTKRSHEDNCRYAPYTCPFTNRCGFLGSPAELYLHLQQVHQTRTIDFRATPRFELRDHVKFVHLLDQDNKDAVFILNTQNMEVISINLDPDVDLEPPQFCYSIATQRKSRYFEFQPRTVPCRCAGDAFWNKPEEDQTVDESDNVRILDYFYNDDYDRITLEVVLISSKLTTEKTEYLFAHPIDS